MFFLDTNIFVYAFLDDTLLKKQRAVQLLEQALAGHSGCISYQVVQEFANVATSKFLRRLTAEQCQQFIDTAMQPLNRVSSSAELVAQALVLHSDIHYSFYDCLIIAAALQAGADTLYTEDLQHNQLIGGTLRISNPFLTLAMQPPS